MRGALRRERVHDQYLELPSQFRDADRERDVSVQLHVPRGLLFGAGQRQCVQRLSGWLLCGWNGLFELQRVRDWDV